MTRIDHSTSLELRRIDLPQIEWRAAVGAVDDWGDLRIWRDPDGPGLIGLGEAVAFDEGPLAENIRQFRGLIGRLSDEVVPAFVASRFEPRDAVADEWAAFRKTEVVLARATIIVRTDETSAILCAPPDELAGLEDRVRTHLGSLVYDDAVAPADISFEWEDARFEARVDRVLERLGGADRLRKVVVARRLDIRAEAPWRAISVIESLSHHYPNCFEFMIRRDESTFLGATPERLVRVRDGSAKTGALAGSATRGATREQDALLGERLKRSTKDREEHDLVTRMIVDELAPISREIEVASEPVLRKLSNVQHLFTPIDATLQDGVGLAEVATRLHPTPAVGGMPRDAARAAIREIEDFDRGLYAGFVGWVDSEGDGDVSVAIRSGLLRGDVALLYAGSGIVSESQPAAEAAETRAKLDAMLNALRGRANE